MEGFLDRYHDITTLKEGESLVIAGKDIKTGKEIVAKIYNRKMLERNQRHRARREGCVLANFIGDYSFVQLHKWVTDKNYDFIILERCALDLLEYINIIKLSLRKIVVAMKDMALSVKKLHAKNLAHRDLKLENFFVREDGSVCIGDFGYATEAKNRIHASSLGTPAYVAPEVLKGKEYDPRFSDIFSLGICFFMMVNLKSPYPEDIKEIYRLKDKPIHVKYFEPVELYNMIRSMLNIDHTLRMNITTVCETLEKINLDEL